VDVVPGSPADDVADLGSSFVLQPAESRSPVGVLAAIKQVLRIRQVSTSFGLSSAFSLPTLLLGLL
jgi:hypothetical protein